MGGGAAGFRFNHPAKAELLPEASFARAFVNKKLGNYKTSLIELDNLVKFTVKVGNTIEQADVLNNRAWLRATCPEDSIRNGQLAVADARKACELNDWELASDIDTLAAAYAEAGNFSSAIRYEEQATAACRALPQQASKTLASSNMTKRCINGPLTDWPRK
jgi:tetratricopeptide (TPR) repeat protein